MLCRAHEVVFNVNSGTRMAGFRDSGKGSFVARKLSFADVVEEIFESILATPKRQRRLLSKTFWGKFGFERRTKERVEEVQEALRQRNLFLSLSDEEFGTESKN